MGNGRKGYGGDEAEAGRDVEGSREERRRAGEDDRVRRLRSSSAVISLMWVIHHRVLLELGASDDPVWVYFDSQHKHIMHQMNQSYKTATALIRGTLLPVAFIDIDVTLRIV